MQEALMVQLVLDNPRGETETPLAYVRRIAILAGLMLPDGSPREPGEEG